MESVIKEVTFGGEKICQTSCKIFRSELQYDTRQSKITFENKNVLLRLLFMRLLYCNAEILCKTRRPSLSLQKIREAMDTFQRAKVELVICLGDLIDVGGSTERSRVCMKEVIDLIQSYQIPYRIIPEYCAFHNRIFRDDRMPYSTVHG